MLLKIVIDLPLASFGAVPFKFLPLNILCRLQKSGWKYGDGLKVNFHMLMYNYHYCCKYIGRMKYMLILRYF